MNKYLYSIMNEIGIRSEAAYALTPETLVSDLLKEDTFNEGDWYELLIQLQITHGVYYGDPRDMPTDLTITEVSHMLRDSIEIDEEDFTQFFVCWMPALDALMEYAQMVEELKSKKALKKQFDKVELTLDACIDELNGLIADDDDWDDDDDDDFDDEGFLNFADFGLDVHAEELQKWANGENVELSEEAQKVMQSMAEHLKSRGDALFGEGGLDQLFNNMDDDDDDDNDQDRPLGGADDPKIIPIK
ncbi:hypothetical protein CYPRO_2596 [Cyclonatronum proteinivorum]|uniref:Uncharacterized protein n=1 Tax=Cyclonatronum proteinivorum TaxID=1457365 RepID=A0A345UMY6_9BACT|nr:hypothetical protein [Cyclonatronum proteinivorum]AXJ01838.1 hypothetical protein CYPRO_2596 [Cyclonatronum proteinivorum]